MKRITTLAGLLLLGCPVNQPPATRLTHCSPAAGSLAISTTRFCSSTGWCWENAPAGLRFRSIWGSADNDVYALADNALMHWNGQAWSVAKAGPELGSYRGKVWGTGRDDVWLLVGGGPVAHWNGETWSDGPQGIVAIDGISKTDIWFIPEQGSPMHFDGSGFTSTHIADPTSAGVSVQAFAANDAWARYGGGMHHWDGTKWTLKATTGNLPDAINGATPDDLWGVDSATGGRSLLHFDGRAWLAVEVPTADRLTAVFALDRTHAWAVTETGFVLAWDQA